MKYFEKDWYFYLKIIPWDSFWEILINSVKANLNAFWKNWIWFWIDIYVFKKNKNIYMSGLHILGHTVKINFEI